MADDLVDTPRVRQIVGAARRDAAERGHRHLGVEHLMLAILDDGASVAAHAIRHSGASFDDIRNYIERVMNSDSYQPSSQAPE